MNPLITTVTKPDLYRLLPSVEEMLRHPAIAPLVEDNGHEVVTDALRKTLSEARAQIATGTLATSESVQSTVEAIPTAVLQCVNAASAFSLRPVINGSGVILHTNLGRAPLAPSALKHIAEVAGCYSNLEFDATTGERGKRDIHVEHLFSRLLNRDGVSGIRTVVVNNCAAAVMLALNTLAEGGEVIVSRGELVEIGGSFRVPDVMIKSGCILREVGTTNRTRAFDYERAITDKTRLLLKVHRSNFAIIGFTEEPSREELAALGRKYNISVMEDLGGGAMLSFSALGLNESGVMDSLKASIDLVTFSGDKMLGGPQAGLLSGREELIKRIRSNPLFRALRVDKLTYAALEATLMEYLRHKHNAIPFARMMYIPAKDIHARAEALRLQVQSAAHLKIEIIPGQSLIGGGSAPNSALPTFLLAIKAEHLSANEIATRLRQYDPPIVARIEGDCCLLDLRTVFENEEITIVEALKGLKCQGDLLAGEKKR